MKIQSLNLKDFMLFNKLQLDWSQNINIICGSNSTGKTALMKLMYSIMYAYRSIKPKDNKDKIEAILVEKLTHVFRTEDMFVGRLARRKQGGSKAEIEMHLDSECIVTIGFSNRMENHLEQNISKLELQSDSSTDNKLPIYLPPKEIISATENFRSLYEDMHIAFEETYYDLARLLGRPLKKGKNTDEQNRVLGSLGDIMRGTTSQDKGRFYLNIAGQGNFEMGLVSEGFRKLATIDYLIRNGAIGKDTILFWDEPETNMNPKMIFRLVQAVMELAKMGVQVFITTHDYFVQQYFNLYNAYEETNEADMDIRFYSLYEQENGSVQCEMKKDIADLEHNAIMEEFNAIYDREQGIIDDRIGERDSV